MTVTDTNLPDPPENENPEDEEAVTAPLNIDALRDEMIITINLYLEALAKVDSENEDDTPRLMPVDWAVVMTGFPETGDTQTFYYRLDASGTPHTQIGLARMLSLALES